ncbi:MAG TPA: hypothetical protein VEU07_12330 [Candidatus Acidoferrum sp.]|nr:hypothetical protein [Candidatus Acidoferrum sp.]
MTVGVGFRSAHGRFSGGIERLAGLLRLDNLDRPAYRLTHQPEAIVPLRGASLATPRCL